MTAGLQGRWPDLGDRTRDLARHFAGEATIREAAVTGLTALWHEILVRSEDDHELLSGSQRLLEILFSNMPGLVMEDRWLQGQLHTICCASE